MTWISDEIELQKISFLENNYMNQDIDNTHQISIINM